MYEQPPYHKGRNFFVQNGKAVMPVDLFSKRTLTNF
ncbi:hypothetical protein M2347_002497 [Chryseobacterium sp. H1D6B]|nr:hypothetical protein [Chryseobacterium sp. H1D6B]